MGTILNFAPWASRLTAMMSGLGIQFGGKRDLYEVFGYKRVLDHRDYVNLYMRQDVAQRIINAPVKATWGTTPQVEGSSTFKKAWTALEENSSLYFYLGKADIFCGLGQYAVLVVGFADGRTLDQPVKPAKGLQISYMQPYLEGSVAISEFDTDETSPRFGLPVTYEVYPGEDMVTMTARQDPTIQFRLRSAFKVHYSRILHVADNTLQSPVFGVSRLMAITNTLWDLQKVVGGAAETYWLTANRGLHVDVDKELDLEIDDANKLSAEVDEYQQQLRRIIRTRGTKVTSLGSDVADPTGVFGVLIALLAANTGIPKRILMGAEAGQLASHQDRANWANQIGERVKFFAEPAILKPFIQLLQAAGTLPQANWSDLNVTWPDPFKMSPFERAQTSAQMARSMANAVGALKTARIDVGMTVFTPEEVRNAVGFGDYAPVFGDKPQGTPLPRVGEGETDQTVENAKAMAEAIAPPVPIGGTDASGNPLPKPTKPIPKAKPKAK